ncbi:MAG: hypothetical protein WCT85_01075 [Parachlamydiales bacterium]|jgi:hypothetical protein
MTGIWNPLSYFSINGQGAKEEPPAQVDPTSQKVDTITQNNFNEGESSVKKTETDPTSRQYNLLASAGSVVSKTLSVIGGFLTSGLMSEPKKKERPTVEMEKDNLEKPQIDRIQNLEEVNGEKPQSDQVQSIEDSLSPPPVNEKGKKTVVKDSLDEEPPLKEQASSSSGSRELSKEEEEKIEAALNDGSVNYYRWDKKNVEEKISPRGSQEESPKPRSDSLSDKQKDEEEEIFSNDSGKQSPNLREEPELMQISVESDGSDEVQEEEIEDPMSVTRQEAEEIFSSVEPEKKDLSRISFKDYVEQIKKMREENPDRLAVLRSGKKDDKQVVFTMRPLKPLPTNSLERKRILNAAEIFIGSIIDIISKIQDCEEESLGDYLKREVFEPFEYLENGDPNLYFNLRRSLIESYKQKMKNPTFEDLLKKEHFAYKDFRLLFAHLSIIDFLDQWDFFKKKFKKLDFPALRMKLAENLSKELQRRKVKKEFSQEVKNHRISIFQLKECLAMQDLLSKSVSAAKIVIEKYKSKFKDRKFCEIILSQLEKIVSATNALSLKLSELIKKSNEGMVSLEEIDAFFESDEWKQYVLQSALFSPNSINFNKAIKKVREINTGEFDLELKNANIEQGMTDEGYNRLAMDSLLIKIIQNLSKYEISLKEAFFPKKKVSTEEKSFPEDKAFPEAKEEDLKEFFKELSFKMSLGVRLSQLLIF